MFSSQNDIKDSYLVNQIKLSEGAFKKKNSKKIKDSTFYSIEDSAQNPNMVVSKINSKKSQFSNTENNSNFTQKFFDDSKNIPENQYIVKNNAGVIDTNMQFADFANGNRTALNNNHNFEGGNVKVAKTKSKLFILDEEDF